MGNNYYLCATAPLPPIFARPRLHIGKSSCGWCFALRVFQSGDDETLPRSLEDWRALFSRWENETQIEDEEGRVLSVQEFLAVVTDRHFTPPPTPRLFGSWDQFHQGNHSMPGPNGLVRSKIDGAHCVGHGDGTWDLIVGDFG